MNIALIAHDKMKDTMIGFCIAYEKILKKLWLIWYRNYRQKNNG